MPTEADNANEKARNNNAKDHDRNRPAHLIVHLQVPNNRKHDRTQSRLPPRPCSH